MKIHSLGPSIEITFSETESILMMRNDVTGFVHLSHSGFIEDRTDSYNSGMIDAFTSFLLALYSARVDFNDPKIMESIEATYMAIGNNWRD